MDYGINLKFNNNEVADGLEKTAAGFDDLVEATADFEKETKKASQGAAKELVAVQSETKKVVGEIQKAGKAIMDNFKAKQTEIASIAIEIAKNSKASEQLASMLKKVEQAKLSGVILDIQAMEEEFTNVLQNVELTDEQINLLSSNIGDVAAEIQKINSEKFKETADKAEKVTEEFKSAKSELRELTNLINSGKLTGADLEQAYARAAELKDRIGDVNDEITRLASDTDAFDYLADGVKTFAAGMQIAEGAASLFGNESEDLQKALIKLNAIMAISNGLSEVSEQLTKKGTLANKAATAAQAVYTTVVGASSGALKVFRLALLSTGIGAIILVLAAVVANWDKVTKSIEGSVGGLISFEGAMNKVKAVLSGVYEFLLVNKDLWASLFTLDADRLAETAKNAGKRVVGAYDAELKKLNQEDINKELAKQLEKQVAFNTKRADILEAGGKDATAIRRKNLQDEIKVLQLQKAEESKILDKQHELAVFNAEREKELADKQREAAEKAAEKRKALLDSFLKELESLNDEEKKLREQNILNSIKDNVEKLKKQQEFELADLELKRKATLEQFKELNKRVEINKVFDALVIENQKKFSQLYLDEQKKLADERAAKAREQAKLVIETEEETINAAIEGGRLSNDQIRALEVQRLENKKKLLNEELEAIRQKYGYESNEAALGMEKVATVTAQIEKKILDNKLASLDEEAKNRADYIDIQLDDESLTVEKRRELEDEKLGIILDSLKAQRALLGDVNTEEALNIDKQIAALEQGRKNLNNAAKATFKNFGDVVKDGLKKAFGLDDETAGEILSGFNQLKSAVIDVINSGYELELSTLEKSIEARQERLDEIKAQIEEEEQRKKDGYANDYDALVAAKANEEQLLKAEQKKALDIKKEQLKQDAILNTAQQAGALATTVANILSGASKLGIGGIFVGLASIISMFAIWRRYKAQANSLAQQAYKGGLIGDYLKPGVKGQSDRPGYGKGHRVEGTNLSIGADEFLTNAESTRKNLPFLREFNSGKYDHIDLQELFNRRAPVYNKGRVLRVVEGYDQMRKEISDRKQAAMLGAMYQDSLKSVIQEQTKALIGDNEKRPTVIPMPDGSVEVIYYEKSGTRKRRIKP